MFKTIILSILLFALVISSPLNDPNDPHDKCAYHLAQQWSNSLLDPPKDVYDRIIKDLAAIRKAYPEMDMIMQNPYNERGQMLMKGFDMEKLNASEYGPIKVESVSQDDLLVIFSRDYYDQAFFPLFEDLIKKYKRNGTSEESITVVQALGYSTQIMLYPLDLSNHTLDKAEYVFLSASGYRYDVATINQFDKKWVYTVEDDKVIWHKNSTSTIPVQKTFISSQ